MNALYLLPDNLDDMDLKIPDSSEERGALKEGPLNGFLILFTLCDILFPMRKLDSFQT